MKKVPEISPTFCVYPWMEVILMPHSKFLLCCLGTWHNAVKDEKGRDYNLVEDRLEDYWNSWGLRQVRKKMLAGEKLKECYWCNYYEEQGRRSLRQIHTKEWLESKYGKEILERVEKSRVNGYRIEEQPLYLDLNFNNSCNLKCRMCGPTSSSKIEQEQKQFKNSSNPNLIRAIDSDHFKIDNKFFNWYKNKDVWKTLYKWAPGLKKLYITGGEPLLVNENWKLIDYLKAKGYSKNIDLTFNTNCTQNPDKIIDTFKNFHSVEVRFSVDGYKEVNEYIRHPSKWEEIEYNVIKMLKYQRENISLYFAPVIQVYNIFDLPRLLKWIDELQGSYSRSFALLSNICVEPEIMNIDILPENIKKKALSKIEKYESSFENQDFKQKNSLFLQSFIQVKKALKREEKPGIEKYLKKFQQYTFLLDRYRGNSFEKTFSELNTLLDKDGRWKN